MTYTTKILADAALEADVPGNQLTLDVDLVPGVKVNQEPRCGLNLTFNTGTETEHDTQIYFELSLDEADKLGNVFNTLINEARDARTEMFVKALEFKSAQLACAKGQIGSLTITKVADSDRGYLSGFGYYDLTYADDPADPRDSVVISTVKNIECYIPYAQEGQYEWLRSLVGGVHQYTTNIKVIFDGFTLAEVTEQFIQNMAEHRHN